MGGMVQEYPPVGLGCSDQGSLTSAEWTSVTHLLEEGVAQAHVIARFRARLGVLRVHGGACRDPGHLVCVSPAAAPARDLARDQHARVAGPA